MKSRRINLPYTRNLNLSSFELVDSIRVHRLDKQAESLQFAKELHGLLAQFVHLESNHER
jgi:hypothetical protein